MASTPVFRFIDFKEKCIQLIQEVLIRTKLNCRHRHVQNLGPGEANSWLLRMLDIKTTKELFNLTRVLFSPYAIRMKWKEVGRSGGCR
jgi:hypothetical protein